MIPEEIEGLRLVRLKDITVFLHDANVLQRKNNIEIFVNDKQC